MVVDDLCSHFHALWPFDVAKGEENGFRNQEINFRKIRHNLQKKGGVWDE